MTEKRIFLRDIKPYAIPESLSDLQGPIQGKIEIPIGVYWGPGERIFDVSTEEGVFCAYVPLLSEGTLEEIKLYINGKKLQDTWSSLVLPVRLKNMWESRFPLIKGRNL
ncbi:transcriptional regulator [Timonella sp. A28]|uniref:transcriptional regulator n=1 Tax=Timonella sp. A28 TaxID=3442640 RepID=UPI003EB8CEF2